LYKPVYPVPQDTLGLLAAEHKSHSLLSADGRASLASALAKGLMYRA